jgi:hypothetical protein
MKHWKLKPQDMATFPVDEYIFARSPVFQYDSYSLNPSTLPPPKASSTYSAITNQRPQLRLSFRASRCSSVHQRMSGTKVLVLKTIFVAVSWELRRITDHLTGAEPRFSKQLALTFGYNKHMCQGRERVRVSITHGTMAISEIAVHIAISLAPWVYLMVPRTASWLGSCFQGFLLP